MKRAFAAATVMGLGLVWMAYGDAAAQARADKGRHVVVVVMDGLRPDSVTAEDMPVLFGLSKQGTFFAHHHPVYLSSTEVNGTALATGDTPQHSGIICNVEFRPQIDPLAPVGMESPAAVRKGDETTDGHYLAVDTMAEVLQRSGRRTAVAGTKGVAILQDRRERDASAESVTLYAGQTLPAKRLDDLTAALGDFPHTADAGKEANASQDAWTTRALTELLWKNDVPALSVLWLSEPDYAQHGTGPGSPVAKAALKSSDDNLGRVIAELKRRNLYDSTDIFVVSDHGFSTISRALDIVLELHRGGFHATRLYTEPVAPDEVMAVGNGGSFSLYVPGHDPELTGKLVKYLQSTDFAGVIFTKKPMDGTFALAEAGVDSKDAPDILVALRWSDDKSKTGMPGMDISEGKRAAGQGNHTSLSKYDMHNTLVAEGPDIKAGLVDDLPSGNIDLAPTVLAILGTPPAKEMDGRVLSEAMTGGADPGKPQTKRVEAAATVGGVKWTQYLKETQLQGRVYYDEGNGRAEAGQ